MSAQGRIGRNDPCPCGSGRKYKKCCLQKDQAVAAPPQLSEDRKLSDPAPRSPMAQNTEWITPYAIAKIAEDPRSAGDSKRVRGLIERSLRQNWTIQKVAAMTTEAIESQLSAYGVAHSRERFLSLAEGRTSAWSISNSWTAGDPVSCAGKEIDFLGLAACELWKRYLPDRPSVEMIDDWMQEGYDLVEDRKLLETCDVWWRVWCVLLPRFTPAMTTMERAAVVFSGMQALFNWCQDLEMELGNAARKDPRYAAIGRRYCTEWRAQFTDERSGTQVNFGRALAAFLFRMGEVEQAAQVLDGVVEKWPAEVWGYVALADAYSHFFPGECELPLDVERAIGFLERGLAVAGAHRGDREALEERLAELRTRRQAIATYPVVQGEGDARIRSR